MTSELSKISFAFVSALKSSSRVGFMKVSPNPAPADAYSGAGAVVNRVVRELQPIGVNFTDITSPNGTWDLSTPARTSRLVCQGGFEKKLRFFQKSFFDVGKAININ